MSTERNTELKPPSGKTLGLAVLGAALLLGLAVLPAEYGIDPTGLGKLTGLTKLSEPTRTVVEADGVFAGVFDVPYKSETLIIPISDLGEVEIKTKMEPGQQIVYAWEVLGPTPNGGVYVDFHGHPAPENEDQFEPGFAQTYDENETPARAGSLKAPFLGYHGWFFMNLEERDIEVKLTVSGFFERYEEVYRAVNGQTQTIKTY